MSEPIQEWAKEEAQRLYREEADLHESMKQGLGDLKNNPGGHCALDALARLIQSVGPRSWFWRRAIMDAAGDAKKFLGYHASLQELAEDAIYSCCTPGVSIDADSAQALLRLSEVFQECSDKLSAAASSPRAP